MIPKSNWKTNSVLSPEEQQWRRTTQGMSRATLRAYIFGYKRTRRMSKTQRKKWLHNKERRAEIIARGSWFEYLSKLFSPWGKR